MQERGSGMRRRKPTKPDMSPTKWRVAVGADERMFRFRPIADITMSRQSPIMTNLLGNALSSFAGAFALLSVSGCNSDTFGQKLPPHRFKLTAYVDTPDGMKTGSSVMEVQWNLAGKVWGTQGISTANLEGQATIVDLPAIRYLFGPSAVTPAVRCECT